MTSNGLFSIKSLLTTLMSRGGFFSLVFGLEVLGAAKDMLFHLGSLLGQDSYFGSTQEKGFCQYPCTSMRRLWFTFAQMSQGIVRDSLLVRQKSQKGVTSSIVVLVLVGVES